MRIRPYLFSVGGGVLITMAGFLSLLLIAAVVIHRGWLMIFVSALMLTVCLGYMTWSLSERLWLEGMVLHYSAWFRAPLSVDVRHIQELCFIHQGLNTEEGIEQCFIRFISGERARIPLGPLWRRRDLERLSELLKMKFASSVNVRVMR